MNIKRPNRIKDLIGKTFGNLEVIGISSESHKGKAVYWACRCLLCNKEVNVRGDHLRLDATTNCRKCGSGWQKIDLSGERFSRLQVISFSHVGHKGIYYWKCLCDCGTETVIRGSSLRSGITVSCGCLQKEKATTHGLTGTKEYKTVLSICRRENNLNLDREWGLLEEQCLRNTQPVCVVCSSNKNLCTDHVLPLSKGYGLKPGNAVRLCLHCNSVKGAKLLHELSFDMCEKITNAAELFRLAWSGGF